MPFDEDIDPLTGNRKVHKHNAEKSQVKESQVTITPIDFKRQFTTKPFQDSVEITVNNPEKRSIETYILDWEEVDALEESLKNAREQAQKTYGK